MRESPYSLTFGTKVVLLPEVIFPTLRIENFTPEASKTSLKENLDLLEERRAEAHLKTLHYQRAITRLYNRRIKLATRWEGPYRVTQEVIRDRTYTLAIIAGKTLSLTWHVSNLKKLYV
ncbi:hypothetical protein BHE74_00013363 [Ensete ventricosum]|nr:hypothetical protein GW17_00039116 [Ensete ventricosum]RWW78416.1 hypothetical protein BHE74_00013363 [Ensete ventricosum]